MGVEGLSTASGEKRGRKRGEKVEWCAWGWGEGGVWPTPPNGVGLRGCTREPQSHQLMHWLL